jgi:hypothetical protein
MLLSFGVLYEVFVNLLKPYSALIDLGKMLFCWAAVFLLLAAFLTALVTSGPKVSRFMMAEELLDRCVHLMQCGLLLLLVLFEKRLNLSWRNSGMCVAIGVGLRAALDLGISYGTDRFPGHRDQMVTLYGVSFIAILAFWAFRLMGTDVAPATSASSPSRIILQRASDAHGHHDVPVAIFAVTGLIWPQLSRSLSVFKFKANIACAHYFEKLKQILRVEPDHHGITRIGCLQGVLRLTGLRVGRRDSQLIFLDAHANGVRALIGKLRHTLDGR